MIDYKHTPSLPVPTSTSSVGPIPTIIPGYDPVFQELHSVGKRTLWVVTVLMGISALVFYIIAARVSLSKRVFHTLISLITTISFITYLALSTGEGITWKHETVKHSHKHGIDTHQYYFRQVFWLRYINWLLTSPLFLTCLAFLSGLPGAQLLVAIAADCVMFSAGILGTFARDSAARWVWFAISCLGYLVVIHQVGFNGSRSASNKDAQTKRFCTSITGITLLVKILYPITLAAGGLAMKTSLDTETIIFAIFDVFSQGILGYWLLISHDSAPGITIYVDGFWANGIGNEGSIRITEEGP
ncbi:hypothetical protein MPDQ_000444 [Monascus purpureus]|uniref:Opsin n=1 Tax=Monascus purpureus TaxID=5098 RepID=A0A507QPV5_MONPU|nr:hypothetical protein MPDQ_000444 [Monascus purpureus]BDD60354.1 hypothetical protein MAP00_005485 [Monascus purpureus]